MISDSELHRIKREMGIKPQWDLLMRYLAQHVQVLDEVYEMISEWLAADVDAATIRATLRGMGYNSQQIRDGFRKTIPDHEDWDRCYAFESEREPK